MKRTVDGVVGFPNDCETVRFTACFVSMLMRAEGMTDDCKGRHNALYNLYTIVTGYGFLQIDLSDDAHMADGWELACQKILREFDYYVGFTMDFAGYDFEEVQAPESKQSIFMKIKASIDRDVPVLMQLAHRYQWVLITGYDDETQRIYGLDGSEGYWGPSPAKPAGYEDGLFVLPDWYEKMAHAFLLGKKRQPGVTAWDALRRGIQIMERMREKGYFSNSLAFMRDDARFDGLSDAALLAMRERIAQWIGQPIDQRAMMGYGLKHLHAQHDLADKAAAVSMASGLCWVMHDVLWIAWNAIGEFKPGERIDWAKGLENKTIRGAVSDSIDFVVRHDDFLLERLKEAFG